MDKIIEISKLELNGGQIEGLPKNPRFIRDDKFEKLKKSIEEFPEMLKYRELVVYPYKGKYVVLGGNMRLRAGKELGLKEFPCKVFPEETPVEKLREFTIKDNIGYGNWDFDLLINEWDDINLENWGMDSLFNTDIDIDSFFEEHEEEDEEKKYKITLEYAEDDYIKVDKALREIASTPEQAVWQLLKLE